MTSPRYSPDRSLILLETPSGIMSIPAARWPQEAEDCGLGTWDADAFTPATPAEPEAAASAPQSVTLAQARAALMQAGLFDNVDAFIKNSGNSLAVMAWEYTNTVDRHGALVSLLAPQFPFSEAELDALFIAADQIKL